MAVTVQGTVRASRAGHGGDLLRDDGTVLAFDEAALLAGGLLMLRLGQRVHASLDAHGAVSALTLLTLPLPAVCEET